MPRKNTPRSTAEVRHTSWTVRLPGKFGAITVRAREDGTRNYAMRGGNQGSADEDGTSLEIYIHALHGLIVQRPTTRVLVIGCAGGTLATMLTRARRTVTLVDIDPAAFMLAKRYFRLPDSVDCRVGDGLRFLAKTRARFDAVVLDAFIGETIPDHFITREFYDAARKRLKPGGYVLVNVCLNDRKDLLADEIASGFAARGWPVRLLDEPGAARNCIVLAGLVKGLRRPKVTLAPHVGAAALKKGVAAMRFRRPSAPFATPRSSR